MFEKYNIYFIKKNDLQDIINLHLEICKITYKDILDFNSLKYFHKKFVKERKKICYNKKKEIHLVVRHKNTNKTIAFADIGLMRKYKELNYIDNNLTLEIKKFFLHPCCQGNGLSRHLFIKLIKNAINKYPNCFRLIVLSFKDNKKANYFYEKMGGNMYKVIKYNINNKYYDVLCYKWLNIYKLIE